MAENEVKPTKAKEVGTRKFNVILAATKNSHGIGMGGDLPWHLPKDMAHFKTTTLSKKENKRNAIIMGRTTWESVPKKYRPMPNRLNIIISRTKNVKELMESDPGKEGSEEPLVFASFDDAINALSWGEYKDQIDDVFVIGGAQLYESALLHPDLNEVYLTEVEKDFECDTKFNVKEFDLEEVRREPVVEDKQSNWQLVVLKRKPKSIPWNPRGDLRNEEELQYLDLIRNCIETGEYRDERTGTGAYSVFGRTMRFSLRDNVLPLLTTKKTFWRGVAEELIWFVNGSTNANLLAEKDIHIWDGNGSREFLDGLGFTDREEGDLGPVYGFQWRHFGAEYRDMHANYQGEGVDQLMSCIDQIKHNPTSRRIIMSAWNPMAQRYMALPPCHLMAQFYVNSHGLSCQMYQRSGDVGLGIPFNIASYALLTRMMAQVCGLQANEFVHVIGDAHVYSNHVEPLQEQIIREPYMFPKLYINPAVNQIDKFSFNDFRVVGYKSYKPVKMEMAVAREVKNVIRKVGRSI